MKVKEENLQKFITSLKSVARAIKSESDDCGELCGGINEKELFIVDYIGQNKNVKMSDVADHLNVPLSTLTNIVDKLVEKKYLSREHSGDDRRVINVMLGDKGKIAYERLSIRKRLIAEKLLSRFSEKDQAAFIKQMNVLASMLGEI